MVRDRLAERLARLRVLERVIGRALREAEALRADPRPRAVEHLHSDPEALPLLAQPVRCGNATACKEELAGRRAPDPHLRLDSPHLEPGRARLDDERRDPAARPGEADVDVRHAGVRDEPLRPVEDVLVALTTRFCAKG